jgi:hypothetical protein
VTVTSLIIYDANGGFFDNPPAFCAAYCEWLQAHGIDTHVTYRTEHHLIDAPFVRVFQVDEDQQGRRYVDDDTGDMAVRPPFDVLITTPPPTPGDYA